MKPVWIIRHVDYVRLGHLPEVLDELSIPWKTVSLSQGESLPALDEVAGVVVMGGPMSAYQEQDYPFFTKEMAFIRDVVEQGIPFLGVCLGAQLMAQAFSAKVEKNPKGYEMGWIPLNRYPEADEDPLFADLEIPPLFQLHGDVFELPEGAIPLLSSEKTRYQAMRMGEKAYGIQFHPETNADMLKSVFEEYQLSFPQEQLHQETHGVENNTAQGKALLKQLLGRLLG